MKTLPLRIIGALTLGIFGLSPGQHLGAGAGQRIDRPTYPKAPAGVTTTRISVSSNGSQGDNESWSPSISADGRYVAFFSVANNLVSGDTNNYSDIFVHDRETGTTERVSVASDGTQGNYDTWLDAPSISSDGRFVAFASRATNLVSGDTNDCGGIYCPDIFVHDRQASTTERVSVSSDGDEGNWSSFAPSISSDGRYVAFFSVASNLVDADTNGADDIFVHDRQTGDTERISISTNGEQGNGFSFYPSISADGRYVAFESAASNLVGGDTNGSWDVFVHDRLAGSTQRVSVSSNGEQGDNWSERASISANGRYVAFMSMASNLVNGDTIYCYLDISCPDAFVHDRLTGATERVSVSSNGDQGNGESNYPSISANGRYVAFFSFADNLVSGDTNNFCDRSNCADVFVHDRLTGITERASLSSPDNAVSSHGNQANGLSYFLFISQEGRFVAFMSYASNLVNEDTNGVPDIFVRDRGEIIERLFLPVVSSAT